MWGAALAAIAKQKTDGTYEAFKKFPRCVENALSLTTTKGEKKEAKVEGGGVEAIKYGTNAYSLSMSFRRGKVNGSIRTFPMDDYEIDGVVSGTYALRVQPEDATAGGLAVREVIISTEDTYTASDGAIKVVTFDFIKPEDDANGASRETIDWSPIPDISAEMADLPVYTKVTNASGNPSTSGYYEIIGKKYVKSADSTVASGKAYYTIATDNE